MDPEGTESDRMVYAMLDLMGDLGGALEIIIVVFGLIFYPISEYSFTMKALKKLYLAKT